MGGGALSIFMKVTESDLLTNPTQDDMTTNKYIFGHVISVIIIYLCEVLCVIEIICVYLFQKYKISLKSARCS